jgi:hypothetical protein
MRIRAQWLAAILCGISASAIIFSGGAALHAQSAAGSSTRQSPQRAANAPQRIALSPQYAPGQVIRYQMQTTTITDTHHGGAIRDPQGPTQLTLVWNAITKLEVLSVGKNAQGQPDGSVRLRSTYEKSDATATSGSYDPEADGMEAKYRALEGKSFEFTVDSAGQISNVEGFAGGNAPGSAVESMRAWLGQLSPSANGPRGGISVGQAWTMDQPVPAAPLAGLVWRSRSTYERNEPCQLAASAGSRAAAEGETCAVILTKLTIAGAKPGHDATPESYRAMGLRTEGTWSGDGDSLSYVSLTSGRLVAVTQSSSEQMDFTVTNESAERVTYKGTVQSHSHLALLPPQS